MSEQRDQIEEAMARTATMSAEDWSRNTQLFWHSCNPPEFFLDRQGYLDTPQNRHRLNKLNAHRLEYKRVKAAVPAEGTRLGSERLNKNAEYAPICDELPLYAWVCVPKHLHDAPLRGSQRRRVGVMVNVIGGGMTTGHSMDPSWTAAAVVQIVEQHSLLYLTWERRVLPESDGNDIYEDSDDYLNWVQNDLHRFLKQRYPHLEIDAGRCLLTADSAGVHIGLRWLLNDRAFFTGAYFRSPLVDVYCRSHGIYMHREVGLEEAAAVICNMFRARAELQGRIPPAKSRKTPEGQFVAYAASVLNAWALLWNAATARELLHDAPRQLHDLPILIVHGSLDDKVPFSSAETLADELKLVVSTDVTLQKLEGAGHCFDYDLDYHSELLHCVREWTQKVLGATDEM
ncbi:hypothetical protein N0V95_010012 [Ascochyta clinopodiicola]|nr:hypothetical protein N0V95_010012 [Ascochyta clinopodiicola]